MSIHPRPLSDDRAEALSTLQHALERTLLLARHLSEDPLVGSQAKGLLSQLDCIQAEVDVIAILRSRQILDNGSPEAGSDHPIWQ